MTFDTAMTLLRQVLVILGAALMSAAGGAGAARAAHNVAIVSTGSSSNGSWAGDTWTASADDATLLASEIETHLASGPTVVSTGGGGTQEGNILVVGGVSWSANRLTLSAANDVTIDAPLTGTGIVALALEYGQGAAAAGNPALYRINVPVRFGSFPSTDRTPHMITRRGSDGVAVERAVPACSGRPGGCPFLKLSPATIDIWYSSTEVDVAADSTHWLYLDWRDDFESQFPYVMGCVQGEGVFYYPRNQEQRNYYDLTGAITDLPGLERTTTTTRFCKDFNDGPILSLLSAQDFPYGYYIRYQPTSGDSGMQYNTLSILVTEESEANTSYRVYDYLVNVRPAGEFPATVDLPPSGHALDFDGIDDYVTIPDADALDLTASYTLEAWIRPDEFTWLGGIISKYTTWGAGGFTLRLGMNGSFSGINFDGMETAEGVLQPGRWQHVAAVNDGGTRHVYVDGVEQPLAGTPITPVANGGPVAIGMDWDGRYFNGAFDEVRVWSTARSPAEIVAAMAGPVPADAAGLAAYYRLDQGVAEGDNAGVTTVDDGTANNHDGTLFNFGLNETVSNWVGLLVHGFCGGDHGGHPAATPVQLCATGVASAVSGTGPWSWSCWGQHGGTSAQCSAYVWTVTPLASAGGTIAPDTPQPALQGATVSFTVTPDPGNAIDLIDGCGGAMTDAETYTTGPITGDCTVTVAFQPAQAITVTQSAPPTAVYDATFDVAATASSGLPVAVTTSGACSGGGAGTATITVTSGTGTCTVRYNQAGDATYAPAPEVTATVDLQKAGTLTTVTSHLPAPSAAGESVVVAFSVTSPQGSPAGDVSVTDGVDGCTAAVSAGSCTLTLSSVGSRSLTATYAGNADFGGSASGAASHEVVSG